MAKAKTQKHKRPTPEQLDERLVIPLETETAIEALLKVDPDSPEAQAARQNAEYPEDETNEG